MSGGGAGDYEGVIGVKGDARCTLVLRCLQEMFCCLVQGRRVQLRLMSRPQNCYQGYYENHNT